MTKAQAKRYSALVFSLQSWGFTPSEVDTLIRAERTLHRWAEEMCNGTIQRDGEDAEGRPYRPAFKQNEYYYGIRPSGKYYIPDREKGAVYRITKLCGEHGVSWYHQTDPRGCQVYILRPGDVPEGAAAESCYTNGLGVCL